MDLDTLSKFADVVGILACVVWLVWKYMPHGIFAPEEDRPKDRPKVPLNEGSKHLENDEQ